MYKPIQNPTQLEFPIWCLNDELAQILKEVQKSMSTDIAGVATNFIVICGGLIGAQYFAEIKKGYKVNSNLFLFNIGASGTGKSVVTGYFMKHVSKVEHKINLNQKERTEIYIGSCTFEQLIELLYHSDQGIISFRDEAIGHFAELGMYSSTGGDAQKALYNQGFSGTECLYRLIRTVGSETFGQRIGRRTLLPQGNLFLIIRTSSSINQALSA